MTETMILFARSTFLEGMAKVLDFGNTINMYNESINGREADARAIASDWRAIIQDYNTAFEKVIEEKDVEKPTEAR